ncbi:MAG: EamA family transporter [Opitutaceae bacterium]|nr:EamA family transporter [Opitutaceae bacterium]
MTSNQSVAADGAVVPTSAARGRVIAAFVAVYLIWGTTYFVLGEVVHEVPPLFMTAMRFVVAGSVLYAWRRSRGAPRPTRGNWIASAWIGALLLLGGYGLTAWAQQRVPSGLTALLVAISPLNMVLLDWLRPGGRRPDTAVFAGLALGLAGMVLLIGPARLEAAKDADLVSTLACLGASLCWSTGSVLGRQARQSSDVFLAAAMQMLVGAVLLLGASAATGEFTRLGAHILSPAMLGGWLYLTIAGSLVAFSAYIYLLKVSTPARVSTYAYVNPAVAVFVGWAFGDEVVTTRILAAAGLLLGGVALITAWKGRAAARRLAAP